MTPRCAVCRSPFNVAATGRPRRFCSDVCRTTAWRQRSVHFSSKTDDWATPQHVFDELDAEFGFDVDVCASDTNHKCADYFTREQNGLEQDWTGTCWMNPPYGREIGRWVAKAHESATAGATVVCLVPARTDTRWWHEYVAGAEVRFLRGRVRFGDATSSAPFPSAVVVFRQQAGVDETPAGGAS